MKVSIIIPFDIDRGWLSEAIKSAENQTYQNIEVIPVQSSGNLSVNINMGVEESTGDAIKILAEDDLLPRKSIQNLVGGIRDVDWVYGYAIGFGVDEQVYYRGEKATREGMLNGNQIHGGGPLYRRECFETVGGFDESLWTGEEYEFHLRLLEYGFKHKYIDELVYLYRHHEQQKSRTITGRDRLKRHEQILKIRARFS